MRLLTLPAAITMIFVLCSSLRSITTRGRVLAFTTTTTSTTITSTATTSSRITTIRPRTISPARPQQRTILATRSTTTIAPVQSSSRLFSSSSTTEDLEAQIKAKGDEIRALKEGGADKATVAPLVEELLALKSKLDPSFEAKPSKKKQKQKKQQQQPKQQKKKKKQASSSSVSFVAADDPNSLLAKSKDLRHVKTSETVGLDDFDSNEIVVVKGWVRTIRKQKTLAFLQVNDGSNLAGIQCVVNLDEKDGSDTIKSELERVTTGASVVLTGGLVQSQGGQQSIEVDVRELQVVGDCDPSTYPLAKKRHSLEYLRSIAHLRARTNTIAAVARVRSQLAFGIHEFFNTNGFAYVQTPLITASDCEGAGELFRVTTLDMDQPNSIPTIDDDDKSTNYEEDFFNKPSFLTVSGQLNAETYACAIGDVYTFGPTFRAENSQTTRHLAEFHMVEPEMAFTDLDGCMDNAESMIQYVVKRVLDNCQEDLQFFNQFYGNGKLLERLTKLVEQPFVRVTYSDAIKLLQDEISKDPSKWQFPEVEFGTDLATEHERWLAEQHYDAAVFCYNYPKSIKAFYMRDNDLEADDDTDNKQTVAAMDLLVPGVGELIGGSQREDRLNLLEHKMLEAGLNPADYSWYVDLRKFGSIPHSGYGLGFERLVQYVCGIDNIRDAIAFPRYPGNAEF